MIQDKTAGSACWWRHNNNEQDHEQDTLFENAMRWGSHFANATRPTEIEIIRSITCIFSRWQRVYLLHDQRAVKRGSADVS